jgi:hypothetical protein
VVILWSRMGTPLPAEYTKADGTAYLSGTEWEFLDAVEAFFEAFRNPDGSLRRSFETYASPGLRYPRNACRFWMLNGSGTN